MAGAGPTRSRCVSKPIGTIVLLRSFSARARGDARACPFDRNRCGRVSETLGNAIEGRAKLRSAHLHVGHRHEARSTLEDHVDQAIPTLRRSYAHREGGAPRSVGGSKPRFVDIDVGGGDARDPWRAREWRLPPIEHVDAPARRLASWGGSGIVSGNGGDRSRVLVGNPCGDQIGTASARFVDERTRSIGSRVEPRGIERISRRAHRTGSRRLLSTRPLDRTCAAINATQDTAKSTQIAAIRARLPSKSIRLRSLRRRG